MLVFAPECLGPPLGRPDIWGQPSSGGCLIHMWCLRWGESKASLSWDCKTKCLFSALGFSHGVGWFLENEPPKRIPGGKQHNLGSCMLTLLTYSVGGTDHGLSQIEGEGTKIPSLNGTSIKEFGAMFSNHHKCSLNLRFCPQTIVTLKEGVLTRDPHGLSEDTDSRACYTLLHAKCPGLLLYLSSGKWPE